MLLSFNGSISLASKKKISSLFSFLDFHKNIDIILGAINIAEFVKKGKK